MIGRTGEPILYISIQKDLYGYIRVALIFYWNLAKELQSIGIVINTYEPCVDNHMANGKQLTMVWYMDDLKLSHMDERDTAKIINDPE